MVELTIEEKAKRYDKAIEKAEKWHNAPNVDKIPTFGNRIIEDIFPELKESEDEKMKKSIIYALRNGGFYDNDKTDEAIAWLEKQGNKKDIHLLELKAKAYDDAKERMSYAYNQNRVPIGFISEIFPNLNSYEKQSEQKPADKVAPKFKVGDWIVWKDKCYKVNYNGCGYELVDQNGLSTSLEYGTIDENAHLWDISKDVKDGDVLVHSSFMFDDFIFIYNKTSNLQAYCYYSKARNRFIIDDRGHYCPWNMQEVTPATKEQRDQLEKAMANAGYKWDVNKKELIKL